MVGKINDGYKDYLTEMIGEKWLDGVVVVLEIKCRIYDARAFE